MKQLQIDFGAIARDEGIQNALDSAERLHDNWGAIAFDFLKQYVNKIPSNFLFMMEDVRKESEGIVPEPLNKRAWGAIAVKAKNAKMIVYSGTKTVSNPKAHKANAGLWQKAA